MSDLAKLVSKTVKFARTSDKLIYEFEKENKNLQCFYECKANYLDEWNEIIKLFQKVSGEKNLYYLEVISNARDSFERTVRRTKALVQ